MNRKVAVFSAAILCAAAGTSIAQPRLVKSNLTPTRLVPTSIAPIYIIDGVEVVGPQVPYSDVRPALIGNRVVFDQYDGDENNLEDYAPIDRGGPCGGAGFLYTANTDSNSSDYYHVRIVGSTDDYKGMDPFGVGKSVSGCALLWMHNDSSEPICFEIRITDRFNENGTVGTSQISGTTHAFIQVTFGGAHEPGLYYTSIDWSMLSPSLFPPLLDTDGGVAIVFRDRVTNVPLSKDQPAHWGTRADELPFPSSDPRPGGQQNPIWYLNDNGALATTPYNLGNAIVNSFTAADIYYTGPNTDPAACFRSTGICWAMFVKDCQPVDVATLNVPADGAIDVENNFPHGPTFSITPGATTPEQFICKIKKNGNTLWDVGEMQGITSTTFDFQAPLQAGQRFGWTITSSSGNQCPSAESGFFTFQMAGCAADYNADDIADFFDYLDFVDDFAQNADMADFNADQIIDFFDYLDFVDAFAAGC